MLAKEVKVGDILHVPERPDSWSAYLNSTYPLNLKFPRIVKVEKIKDMGHSLSMTCGEYGWSLCTLLGAGARPATPEEIANPNIPKTATIKPYKEGDRVIVVRKVGLFSDGNNKNAKVGDILTVDQVVESQAYPKDPWIWCDGSRDGIRCSLVKPFEIELGKKYVRRDGEITGQMKGIECSKYPYWDDFNYHSYTKDGKYLSRKKESNCDLVKEYKEEAGTTIYEHFENTQPMTEETVQVSVKFVKKAYEAACDDWKKKIKKGVPSLFPEVELKVGNWYFIDRSGTGQGDSNKALICYQGKGEIHYGFSHCNSYTGKYGDSGVSNLIYKSTPATDQEVFDALVEEAKKRGYVKGAKVDCLVTSFKGLNISDGEYKGIGETEAGPFSLSMSGLWVDCEGYGALIFRDGTWAEIIKEEPIKELTLEEVAKLAGVPVNRLRIKE